jgi:chlorite dismutase
MTTQTTEKAPGLPHIDVHEYGGKKDGERQKANRRMFMQLLVFELPANEIEAKVKELTTALESSGIGGVIYADTMDPRALGLLTWSEDPSTFVRDVRPLFTGILANATMRPDFAMIGRTYALGHEPELLHWLLEHPVKNALNPETPWHVWYPLRRSGAFARLDPQDVSSMMREHGAIGHAYGQAGLGHDIRLACHGLDAKDNEFVIGLVGKELHPLSHLVQSMRKTRQTSEYIVQMGPFFVGYALARVKPRGT